MRNLVSFRPRSVLGRIGANRRDVMASPEFLRYLDQLTRAVEALQAPTGTLRPTLDEAEPFGWKLLNGQALRKSEYATLYAMIGDTFGSTAETFNLPDAADRSLIGAGAIPLAEFGGSGDITLTLDNLPSHAHGVTDSGHSHTFTGDEHSHGITDPGHAHGGVLAPGNTGGVTGSGDADYPHDTETATTGISVNPATAGGTISTDETGVTIDATGGGAAFDNTPLGLGVNYLIKA